MLSVSENFHLAAKATTRHVKAKIDIIWTAPSEDTSITVTTNGTNRAANLPQVYDGVSDIPKPWAHLDGTIKADGNHRLMPNPASLESQEQVGWYGSVRSNASAEWATNPELTMEFDARPVISLYVAGDTYYNEYPVDFTLKLYAVASLEYTETVTGNTLLKWSKNVSDQSLASITKIILTISKWSAAARIVKISEVYTSFYQTFSGDEIVSMNLLEERVIGDGSLPIGNISSNECDITLNNVKINVSGTDIIDPFFPSNTNSLYYELIKKNRRVEPYLGYLLDDGSIEYIKLGVFWTGDWSVNEQDYTASVSCRDRMELLRKAEYTRSPLFESSNLYDIAQSVLEYAKANIPMASLTWQIDTELQNYTMDYAWFPKQTYFKTIKQIAEACMGQAYMSKNDVLMIEGPGALQSASVAQLTITSPSGSTWVQSPTVAGQHELPIGVSDANLIAWWGMDNGLCKDYSGNAIDGTVLTQTATTDRYGNANSALYFSGANVAGITVPLVSTTKSYSFSMWVNAKSKTVIYQELLDIQSGRMILLYVFNTTLKINIYVDGNFREFGAAPSLDAWHHLVFIVDDATNAVKVYIDGIQLGSALAYNTGLNIGGTVKIGSRYAVAVSSWYDFKGSMDDCIIWDRVITEEEITALYQSLPDTTMYQYAITWVTNPLAPTDLVKIELYKAGVFHSTITASTVNDGSYTWIIDSALIPTGNDYQIKITHLSDPYVNDLSDYLAIDKEYWTDENGDFVTDENGDPIPQN